MRAHKYAINSTRIIFGDTSSLPTTLIFARRKKLITESSVGRNGGGERKQTSENYRFRSHGELKALLKRTATEINAGWVSDEAAFAKL